MNKDMIKAEEIRKEKINKEKINKDEIDSDKIGDTEKDKTLIKCDVIQDLMPSYLDEICSEASRELVENHMGKCESCRKRCELLRNWSNDFAVDSMEQKQLDGMKKIRKKISFQKGLLLAAFLYIIWLGYHTFIEYSSPFFPIIVLQVVFQIMLLAATGIFAQHMPNRETGDRKSHKVVGMLVVTIIFSLAAYLGMHMAWGHLEAGAKDFFGIEWVKVGPALSLLFGVGFVTDIGCLLYYGPKIFDTDMHRRWVLCIFLTGALLMVAYGGMLHNMTSAKLLIYCLDRDTAVITGIGMLGVLINLLYDRIKK